MEEEKISKKDIERKEIYEAGECLEDISTITREYVFSKMSSIECRNAYFADTCSLILPVLHALNTPSEGKRYIVPYKNCFIVNKGGWRLKVKTIELFSVGVCTYASQYMVDMMREITNQDATLGEGELLLLNRKVKAIMKVGYPQLTDPNSKLYTLFKTSLEVS